MKKLVALLLGTFAVISPACVQAQTAMVVGQPSAASVLRQGTTLRLRTISAMNSKDIRTGQMFDLETVDDVLVDGHIVIPRGSPARGEVTFAKQKGMWGKSGKIDTQLLSVRANGVDIAIRGTASQKGDTGTAGVVGAIAFLPVAGFFVTGTSASLAAGTSFTGVVVNDMPLTFSDRMPASPSAARAVSVTPAALQPSPAIIDIKSK